MGAEGEQARNEALREVLSVIDRHLAYHRRDPRWRAAPRLRHLKMLRRDILKLAAGLPNHPTRAGGVGAGEQT